MSFDCIKEYKELSGKKDMKVVLIHGQSHKGTTYHMGRLLAEKLAEGENIREFFLPRDLNHFCIGCYACIEDETHCPWWSEKEVIIDALEQADLFIFTSPNYCMGPSAAMKSFLDLMFDNWMVHRPKEWMFQKRAVILCSSAGASSKGVTKLIKQSLFYWGIPYIKAYSLPVHAMNWEMVDEKTRAKIEKKITDLATKIRCVEKPRIGIKTKMMFFVMGRMHAAGWDASPTERQYWQQRGWLDRQRPWKG